MVAAQLVTKNLEKPIVHALWCAFNEARQVYAETVSALQHADRDYADDPGPSLAWFKMEQHGQQYAASRVIRKIADGLKISTMRCGSLA